MITQNAASLLNLNKISKCYSSFSALGEVSLSVNSGEIVLLAGANGAGKSTLLRIISGLAKADTGSLTLNGEPPKNFRSKVGYLGHDPLLYPTLTVRENLTLFGKLYASSVKIDPLLQEFRLIKLAERELGTLSKGELSRVGICRTFLNDPKLFLLDEPTSSLDEASTESLMRMISASCKAGAAAIIASHDLRRLLPFVTRLIVLKQGQIVRDSGSESVHSAVAIQWYVEAQY